MIRVLIVDDSAVFRREVSAALATIPEVEVVGTAANGRLALETFQQRTIDVAIVDMEMPELNGIELLDEICDKAIPVKVIVFASATKSSALMSLKALNRGAFDFVIKPQRQDASESISDNIRAALESRIKMAYADKSPKIYAEVTLPPPPRVQWEQFHPLAVVIGSSTGGPPALEKLLTGLSKPPSRPIFIVQHMPPLFTAALAERLSAITGLKVVEAHDRQLVQEAHVYIAPGGFHMRLKREGAAVMICLDLEEAIHSIRPAVDPLFNTAAEIYGPRLLAMILTGMGEDGRAGCVSIKRHGGVVAIQDAKSCVVYGMPKAVHDAGAFDLQTDLDGLRAVIARSVPTLRSAS